MTRRLRTLEEICALEDRYPLTGSNPAGLMRWLYAVGQRPVADGRKNGHRDARRAKARYR
jgi:hypothetical protein